MMKSKMYLMSCLDFLKNPKDEYDYVLTSPPEFTEIGLSPPEAEKIYFPFLEDVFSRLNPRRGVVTIVTTDRKFSGQIIDKHTTFIRMFKNLGYEYWYQKIHLKQKTINIYRLTYSYVMTFRKRRQSNVDNKDAQFQLDWWLLKPEIIKINKKIYKNNFPTTLASLCIRNFTKEGDVVFDPFAGSGTTLLAALNLNRRGIGCEIDESVYNVARQRLNTHRPLEFI